MTRMKQGAIRISAIAVVVVGLVIIAAGCSSMPMMRPAELPTGLQVVGGGFNIYWEAPAKGTVYLVEKTSGKAIATESVEEGEAYEFDLDPEDDANAFKAATGVELKDARLVLYFKPVAQ